MYGFITNGTPKTTGSLISNIFAGKHNFPNEQNPFSYERIIIKTSGKVAPPPPKKTNIVNPLAVI